MLKKLLNISLVALVFIASWSCEQHPNREELKKEVMDVHDYAMAKMGTLHDLESKISAAVDTANEAQMKDAASKINALRKADEDMMDWMRQYKEPKESLEYEKMVLYFNEQKVLIEQVKVDTDKSIAGAEEFLKNIKAAQ